MPSDSTPPPLSPPATKPARPGRTAAARAPQLADLKPDPKNRRNHPPNNRAMIGKSLLDVGAARSIVIDEHDQILAGNGVVEAATEQGFRKVRVIEADGKTVIAVRRRGLTDEQKRQLAMYDNRTAELSEWNGPQLREDIADGLDLKPFFSAADLATILKAPGAAIKQLQVERPHEVVWVLVAVPLEDWPAHQAAVEALQQAGVMVTIALRPHEKDPDR